MQLYSVKIVRIYIALLLLSLTVVMLSGRCLRAPAPLNLLKLGISGYGVAEVPKRVAVVHHNWSHPHNRIELTFEKELDPGQEVEILLFQSGQIINVHPEHTQVERKYFHYLVRKDRLTIQSVKPKTGLPMNFVTLILPAELRAKDGTTLGKDTFLWLSTFWPTPQGWIMTDNQRKDVPLILPVWGKDDGRTIAYLLEDAYLSKEPDEQGEQLVKLVCGNSVEIIETRDEWSQVKVYYPKYAFTDLELQEIPANFDVWQSDLVSTVTGHLPTRFLYIIPRPGNTYSYVTVNRYFMGHDAEDLVIAVRVNTLPIFSGTGGLKPGDRLIREQLDFLEVRNIGQVDYWTAGSSFLADYGKPGLLGPASKHDPWVHHPQYSWSEEQYNLYLRIRRAYIEKLEGFWKEYQVAPKYQRFKDGYLEVFKKRVKIQDIWIAWSRVDKELRLETFAGLVSEGFGKTPEEKEKIFKLFTDGGSTLDYENPGFLNFLNSYISISVVELIEEIEEEYERLKLRGLGM